MRAGIYFYHAWQDRTDERGFTPDAESGMLRNLNTGERGGAIFAEKPLPFWCGFARSRVRGWNSQNQGLNEQIERGKTNGMVSRWRSQSDFNFCLHTVALGLDTY